MLNVSNAIGRNAVRAGKTGVMRAEKSSIEINVLEPSAATQANCAAESVDKSDAQSAAKNGASLSVRIAALPTARNAGRRTGKIVDLKIDRSGVPRIGLNAAASVE